MVSPAEHRYLMAVIATASNPRFTVSRVDIDRPGPTYTVDTLTDLREQRGPGVELFFITGADALAQILTWKDAEELFALAHFIGVTRPGHTLSDDGLPEDRVSLLEVPAMAISSTDCRDRVRRGEPVWYLVPDGVVQYVVEAPPLPAAAGGCRVTGGSHEQRQAPPAGAGPAAGGRSRQPPRDRGHRRRRPVASPVATPASTGRDTGRARPVAAPAVPGQTVVARRSRAAERAARRRALRQRVLLVTAAVLGVVLDRRGRLAGAPRRRRRARTRSPQPPPRQLHHAGAGDRRRRHRSSQRAASAPPKPRASRPPPSWSRPGCIVDVAGSGEMPFGEAVALDDETASTGAAHGPARCLGRRQLGADHRRPGRAGRLRGRGPGGRRRRRRHHRRQGQRDRRGAGRQPAPEGRRPPRRTPPTSPTASPSRPGSRASTTSSPRSRRRCRRTMPALRRRAGRARRRVAARRWTPRRWPTGWPCCGSAADDGSLVSDVLPVTEIDTGGAVPSYGLDAAQADATMRARFPGALQQDANGREPAGPGRERRRDPRAGGEGPHQAGGRRVPVHQRRQRLAVQQPTRAACWCRTAPTRASSGADGSPPPSGCRRPRCVPRTAARASRT